MFSANILVTVLKVQTLSRLLLSPLIWLAGLIEGLGLVEANVCVVFMFFTLKKGKSRNIFQKTRISNGSVFKTSFHKSNCNKLIKTDISEVVTYFQ